MLQVNRKKERKPVRRWIPLTAALLLAAAGTLAAFGALREEPVPVREDHRGSLMEHETSEIRRIRIQLRNREPWTAVRNEAGSLVMETADGWAMDAALGERVEDALAHVVYEEILSEDPAEYADRLEDFGLADPALTAEVIYSDGKELKLCIGNSSGLGDEDFRYMTVEGDPRLYAAAGSLMEDLNVEQELLHPVPQPEIQTGRLDRITVRDGSERPLAEWTLNGAITDPDAAAGWQISFPIQYPADQDRLSGLRKNVGNLRLGMYVCEGTEDRKKEYGLIKPRYEISLHLAAGAAGRITEDGAYDVQQREEENIRFLIGAARNEMTDYCLYDGTVYTVNHFTVAAITELDPLETAARYPVTVPLESLSSLEIRRDDGTADLYELTRIQESADPEAEENQTEIRCRKNGEEIPYSVFEAAYERWRVVDVSGRLPEGWVKKPSRIQYLFRTVNGREHILEFSDFDGLHDAVTVDGQTLFYLIRDGMGTEP